MQNEIVINGFKDIDGYTRKEGICCITRHNKAADQVVSLTHQHQAFCKVGRRQLVDLKPKL